MPHLPFRLHLLLLTASMLLAGCQSTGATAADGEPMIPDEAESGRMPPKPAFADGPVRREVKSVDGAALNPLKASSLRVTYTDGSRKGDAFAMTTNPGRDGAYEQVIDSVRSMTLKGDAGKVILLAEEDVDENVRITYDPPITLIPHKVATGHRHEGRTTMTVLNRETGKRRDSGPCTYTVELLGMQTIATPAGRLDAYVFRTVREIDLSLADVKVTIHTAHVPDQGIVMTRVQQNTRAIGFLSMNKKEEWRLSR